MKHRVTLSVIAAVIAVGIYAVIPERHYQTSVYPVSGNVSVSAYDDSSDGGTSRASMNASDSALDFECTLGGDPAKNAWCGLIWNMDPQGQGKYENWSFMDSIIMDFDASGTQQVIVKIWTYDPDVTDSRKNITFRQLLKEVPVKEGHNHIAVPVEEFYVPDFWYDQTGAKRTLTNRQQESVARFEITPGWNTAPHKQFKLHIVNIQARGVSSAPLGILLGVFIVLAVFAISGKKGK